MGLSPFLAYIEKFTTNYQILRGKMFNLVIRESNLHNDKVSKYSISNSELFDPVQPQQNNFGFRH